MKGMTMRHSVSAAVFGLLTLVTGCTPNVGDVNVPTTGTFNADIALSEQAKTFVVSGGAPVRHSENAMVDLDNETATGGSIAIDPAAISVTSSIAAKTRPRLQAGLTEVTITVWIGALDLADLTCDMGEQYGPFTATLDAAGNAVAVQPPSVPLTQTTIDLLPQFVVCIEVDVLEDIDVTIDIATLTLNLDTVTNDLDQAFSCTTPGDCPEGFACSGGRCIDSRDEMHFDETNFPDCTTANFNVDPGDIFCRSNADCPADTECCTGPEICGSNPCTCR